MSDGGVLIPRRALLRGGLAGFAAAMMTRALPGCGDDAPTSPGDAGAPDAGTPDAGTPDVGFVDAGAPDAGAVVDDAGLSYFAPRPVPAPPPLRSLIADIGALGAPDANGLRLPPGFTSRVIGRTAERVAGTDYTWHLLPDGGATFATEDGGWIYASNSEMPLVGGVGAVRFSATGAITRAYRILDRTNANCAGCKTPWHTWLSCEEVSRGRVFECDPYGERAAVARPALGSFKHEAAAVDTANAHVYLTEDEPDGRLYRYVPARRTPQGHPDLSEGRLEVATVDAANRVTWQDVPDPRWEGAMPTRLQVPGSTVFNGGEGIWYHAGVIYFSTKGTNQVWSYRVAEATLSVIYDGPRMAMPGIRGVDNLTVTCCGDVLVAEDTGSMQVVAIMPGGGLKPLVQVAGHENSEVTGPAFDPGGTRLYFSSQRGLSTGSGAGWTFEVTGPFHAPMA
ncbi:MAG: hypothetical protein JWM10_1680 [Myxococcaceae bacterium]|nr:hypothetical protein [Myxococcaceae bacterium]